MDLLSKVSIVNLRVTVDQVMEADKTANGHLEGVKRRKFTWRELSKLNGRHNAHVAVRGKVLNCVDKHITLHMS